MNKFLLSIVLITTSTNIFAQLNKIWQYDNHDAYNYFPTTNIIHYNDYNYVCSQVSTPLAIAFIFKIDSIGNAVAQDSIQGFDYSIVNSKRMIADGLGSFYLIGTWKDTAQHNKIRIIKYDSDLNRQWDKTLHDTDSYEYTSTGVMYSPAENKIYVVGRNFILNDKIIAIKTDTSGNLEWEYTDTLTNGFSLTGYAIDHIGNVILGGYGVIKNVWTGEDFLIMKIDTSGNLNWAVRKDGSNTSDDMLTDVVVDIQNNVIASGIFSDTINIKVIRFDQNGNEQWSTGNNFTGLNKLAVDHAGSIYVASFDTVFSHEFYMTKYDSSGNILHSVFSDVSNYDAYSGNGFNYIEVDDTGSVYILNNVDSAGIQKWFIAKVDSSLNLKWTYIDSAYTYGLSSRLCRYDNGIVVTGSMNGNLSVVRFEENYLSTDISQLSLENLTSWPNPIIDKINFQLDDLSDDIVLSVFDVSSKLIFQSEHAVRNSRNVSFQLPLIKPGIYFFQLKTKEKRFYGKFISAKM